MNAQMEHSVFSGRAGLRIDVDFAFGWQQAVPYMLDRLRTYGMQATFFVTGTNPLRSHRSRLASVTYLKRLWGLRVWRLQHVFGSHALHKSEVLADGLARSRDLIQRMGEEGHEFALHGYDHSWWSEQVWRATEEEVRKDIERAYDAARDLGAEMPLAWASPSWRTRNVVLQALHEKEAPYASDSWGQSPYLVRMEQGEVLNLLQLPVSVSSFERPESIRARSDVVINGCMHDLEGGPYSVIGLHDYFEGGLRRDLFELLLKRCRERGVQLTTLGRMAASIREAALEIPVCSLHRAPISGFRGDVSWQGL